MEFEWDEVKSDTCLEQRGFDFAYVIKAFIDPDRMVKQDHRWDYGEGRYQVVGHDRTTGFLCGIHSSWFNTSNYFCSQS
jgi:uncharacterized DUF497 family protein